jgi:hypothetical protein
MRARRLSREVGDTPHDAVIAHICAVRFGGASAPAVFVTAWVIGGTIAP